MNTTVHSSTGFAPVVLHFGKNPRLNVTQQFLSDSVTTDHSIDLDKAVTQARARIECVEKERARQFNLSRFAAKLFSTGDIVAVEDSQLAGGGKLKPRYSGPFVVKKILPNERYLLNKKGKRDTVAAHEQLRPWPVSASTPNK